MRIIARKTLKVFWELHPDVEQALRAWFANVKKADWQSPAEIKAEYPHASFLAHQRVIFNIKGNHYRLVVAIKYEFRIVYIRFVGTHAEYDKIDATLI